MNIEHSKKNETFVSLSRRSLGIDWAAVAYDNSYATDTRKQKHRLYTNNPTQESVLDLLIGLKGSSSQSYSKLMSL